MPTINLKDFYPWYTHDEYVEVFEEVAAELLADKRYERAHQRRVYYNKAQYSLDAGDGIENAAIATRVSVGAECSLVIEDGYVVGEVAPQQEVETQWKAGVF